MIVFHLVMVAFTGAVGVEGPRFLSSGSSYRIPLDAQVHLPCNVSGMGDSLLVWKQGSRVIFAGGLRVRQDDRFNLDGTHLVISYARAKDSGVYTCQIETKTKTNMLWIEHTLLVETPPVVYSAQTSVSRTVGESLELTCSVRGSPDPTVAWTLENRDLTGLEHRTSSTGSTLYLSNLTRGYSGNYTCTARNGVGLPVSRSIVLTVLYGPEIELERKNVHTRQGCSASLVCFVSGNPAPEVKWFQNTLLLVPSKDVIIKSIGWRNELVLSEVEVEGRALREYICTASNTVASVSKKIRITGLPERPLMYDYLEYLGNSEYLVEWSSKVFSSILKHRLTYKQVKENESNSMVEFGEKIIELSLGKVGQDKTECDLNKYKNFSYILHNLEFGAYYEVKVASYNKYGWSELSNSIIQRTNPEFVAKKVHKMVQSEMIQSSEGSLHSALLYTWIYISIYFALD